MRQDELRIAVEEVVEAQNCSGCGGCAQISTAIAMQVSKDGFLRPTFSRPRQDMTGTEVAEFKEICPGVRVSAATPLESWRHPYLGAVVSAWRAWASDPIVRTRGSSGGTLTAISNWIVENCDDGKVVGAAASLEDPRQTVALTITSKEEALRAAGSRYAPASNLAHENALQEDAFVGKPCEISALSRLCAARNLGEGPLRMSFFCAGVPSQNATDQLVEKLGVGHESALTSLQYRGDGWPGQFRAEDAEGNVGTDRKSVV